MLLFELVLKMEGHYFNIFFNIFSAISETPEPELNSLAPRVRKQSLVNCAEIMSKSQLDFGTRQSDAGSIENCLMTLRTELNRLGK